MTENKTVWSNRFSEPVHPYLNAWGTSIHGDRFLWREELQASRAYARALEKAGVLCYQERLCILEGLERVWIRIENGEDLTAYEDIHSAVELMLTEEAGDAGKKLHTGRSRNDQVATVERLWLLSQMDTAVDKLTKIQRAAIHLAEKYSTVVMPGFTHLQQGQPVLFSFYIMTLFWQMQRGKERLADALKRVAVLPLGSGALAGSTVALDRQAMAEELGFFAISENAMDAVSDRSFILEVLSVLALILADLSRFAEDTIVFASKAFHYVRLEDAVATSSSLLPQKRNPDFYELLRAAPARVFGQFCQLFMTVKGLPLAYNKDLQEDKLPLQSVVSVIQTLEAAEILLRHYRLAPDAIGKTMDAGMLSADLADALVQTGLSFRDAHGVAGALVQDAERKGRTLTAYSAEELEIFSPVFALVPGLPDFETSVRLKRTAGSTHPDRVLQQIDMAKKRLEEEIGRGTEA